MSVITFSKEAELEERFQLHTEKNADGSSTRILSFRGDENECAFLPGVPRSNNLF